MRTPIRRSALPQRLAPASTSPYVMSWPSYRIATRLARPSATWRSTNHVAALKSRGMSISLRELCHVLTGGRRLTAAAQVLGQERLHGGVVPLIVLRSGESVPFVRKHDVLDVLSVLPHRRDDLIALRLLHAHVVRALHDEQRDLDLVRLEERRAGLQKLFLRFDLANPLLRHLAPYAREAGAFFANQRSITNSYDALGHL